MWKYLTSCYRLSIALLICDISLGNILMHVVSYYYSDLVSSSWDEVYSTASPMEDWMSVFPVFGRSIFCDWSGSTRSVPDTPSCGFIWCVLYLLNTESCFQWEMVVRFLAVSCIASKKLLCWTWNYRYTMAVSRLRISKTELECLGGDPR